MGLLAGWTCGAFATNMFGAASSIERDTLSIERLNSYFDFQNNAAPYFELSLNSK